MLSLFSQVRHLSRPARLFLLGVILDGIVFNTWWLFFNFYILEKGFSREFLGLVTASNSAAGLFLSIPLGLLSDRLGRKPAMILGVTIFTLCSALQVALPQPEMIVMMGILAGVGYNLYYLSQAPFMMKVSTPETRTLLFTLSFGVVTLSGAIANLFAGQLPAVFAGLLNVPDRSAPAYQAVLLGATLLGTLTLIPLSLIREPKEEPRLDDLPRPRLPLRSSFTQPAWLKLAFPNLCIGFGAAILVPYFNIFFNERFGISDQMLGVLFALSSVFVAMGSLLAPRLEGLLGGKIRTVAVTQALSLLFLLVMGFVPNLSAAVVGFLMRGTLMNMAAPLMDAFAMGHARQEEQGALNSLRFLAWQASYTIGPYVSGVVQQRYGYSPLFLATACAYGMATLSIWFFFGRREKEIRIQQREPEAL